jgi:metal-sulfur cluster biosynthetic enzyme
MGIEPELSAALKGVLDPELGINIVDLGLVYRAERAETGIEVAITMTSPSCPIGEMLVEEAKAVLQARFPDVSSVEVEVVWDPPWSLDRMSDTARRELGWTCPEG